MRSVHLMVIAVLMGAVEGFTPLTRTFATFGNPQTKSLLAMWKPQPLDVPEGDCFTPDGQENVKRFVRARLLLEDPSVGSVAGFGDSLCVILCRFNTAEHAMLLPLWQGDVSSTKTFEDMITWHKEAFPDRRLSGSHLEWAQDKDAWSKVTGQGL